MKKVPVWLCLLFFSTLAWAAPPPAPPETKTDALQLTIRGEVDAAFAPTVGRITALYYECYPLLLKRFDHPQRPAARHVTFVFQRGLRVPAYCVGNELTISIEWLTQHPQDIALVTHELTHVVQAYPAGGPGWLVEGIADYARHQYGPPKQPGWQLPDAFTAKQSYTDGYRTTAKFLVWLEEQHPGVVDKLHRRLQAREFALSDFEAATGSSVEELWTACVAALNKP